MCYTDKQIENFIMNRIKTSVENDVGKVLPTYFENECGFFAIPRLLLPEIDGMGAFFTGEAKNTVKNIKTYLAEAMSHIDARYDKYAFFIAVVYRHGLLHQHSPKNFKYKNKEVGWSFVINSSLLEKIQRKTHLEISRNTLRIDMNLFYHDFVNSIPIAKDLIVANHKENFTKAFKDQTKYLTKTGLLNKYKGKKLVSEKDFEFIELL